MKMQIAPTLAFEYFMIFYSKEGNVNQIHAMAGQATMPTIDEIQATIYDIKRKGEVPTDRPVYMIHTDAATATKLLSGEMSPNGLGIG